MKVELIKAERLCYGDFRYRVQVRRGPFRWHTAYLAKASRLGTEWYTHQSRERIWSPMLVAALDRLLDGALAQNLVQPEPLPFAVLLVRP